MWRIPCSMVSFLFTTFFQKKTWQPLGPLLKVKLLVGYMVKSHSTQRSVSGIRRSPKMCQDTNALIERFHPQPTRISMESNNLDT